jgi:hypothetical protein
MIRIRCKPVSFTRKMGSAGLDGFPAQFELLLCDLGLVFAEWGANCLPSFMAFLCSPWTVLDVSDLDTALVRFNISALSEFSSTSLCSE